MHWALFDDIWVVIQESAKKQTLCLFYKTKIFTTWCSTIMGNKDPRERIRANGRDRKGDDERGGQYKNGVDTLENALKHALQELQTSS